ncbi:hypothetical protein FRC06_007368, partial [Ceratobasidium sp. 370]
MEAQFGYAVELELHRALNLEKRSWQLFPTIPIISADLEEHDVRKLMERAQHMNVGQTEAMLHEHSYRPVQ